jgi:hypothetical protein
MSDLKKAAQQALEFIKVTNARSEFWLVPGSNLNKTVNALRAALELPEQEVKGCDHCNHPLYAAIKCRVCGRVTEQEQEPVAWRFEARHIDSAWGAAVALKHPGPEGVYMRKVTPLYTHPPRREWRGLTDNEIINLARGVLEKPINYSEPAAWQLADGIARAIEAALKERNV